jgi:hypothetical protein
MSTAAAPRRAFDHDESQRRVRHPLQTLRKYIRAYVALEGLAIAILFLAAWFWGGLLIDYGTFRLFAFDWLQELRDLAPDSSNATLIRVILLAVLFVVLAALVITKVALRWIREFNDPALALVLERRFPHELGDRLITAVELADPKMAKEYGYSQPMVEHTIADAVERIDRVPVSQAFNWGRLVWWWVFVGLATFGMLLLVGVLSIGIDTLTGAVTSPTEFPWRFADVSAIWTERNLLLKNTYWPRSAYLELARFQPRYDNPNEMRVPRDEARPELLIRAVEWVIADPDTPDGWRALRWEDLTQKNLIDPAVLARVNIPADWPNWTIDLDELDAKVPLGLVPATLQDRTAGEVRKAIDADPLLVRNLQQAGAWDAVSDDLLNWQRWTVDRIAHQKEHAKVRVPLRQIGTYEPLADVFAKLDELAGSPSMSRTLRRLTVPQQVRIIARGDTTVLSETADALTDNEHKFIFPLDKLKESARLRVRGEDYYTPAKTITLVAPPSVRRLSVDKEEPAYIYHRIQGGLQDALAGKKQIFRDYTVSITGELSTIDVPIGTNLVVHAETDRKLRAPVRIKGPPVRDAGIVVPDQTVQLGSDNQSFAVEFTNVARTLDFLFEFTDEDNVRGRRHVRIRPVDDLPPSFEGDVGLAVILRKPRARGADAKSVAGSAADSFLITPDALLPFVGQIRDDHGLTRVGWLFEAEPVDVELIGPGKDTKEKLPKLVLGGNAKMRRAGLVTSLFQYNSASAAPRLAIPNYVHLIDRVLTADLSRAGTAHAETFVMMDRFKGMLEAKTVERDPSGKNPLEIPETALADRLQKPARPLPGWELNLRDEQGFDVQRLLPKLKADAKTEGQLHYLIKLSVLATDNNIENGRDSFKDDTGRTFRGNSTRSRTPLQFLVVSENELLAQIALEEEALYEQLDKAYEKLRLARTLAEEQIGKLSGAMRDDEMVLVSLRLDETRKAIIDAGSDTRQVASAYSNILKEMKANRVQKDRTERIEDKIVWPLERVVDSKDGNFVVTDELFQKAYIAVDEDVQGSRGLANKVQHQQNVQKAEKELDVLMERMNSVLIALNLGMSEAKGREMLIVMERNQRQVRDHLRVVEVQIIEELLNTLKNKN